MRKLIESIAPITFSGFPDGSTIYGCELCMCFWVDSSPCFLCGNMGLLIAKPIRSTNISIALPVSYLKINGTHYIDNEEIALIVRESNRYV